MAIRDVVELIKGVPNSSVDLVMGRQMPAQQTREITPPTPPAPEPAPPSPQVQQQQPREATPPAQQPQAPPPPPPAPATDPTPPPPPQQAPTPPSPPAAPPQQPTPDNKQNGFVVKNWPDGKQYRGEMLDGKRHGKGSITYPDGASYEGDWHNDWRHGHGEYKYTDGTWYKGQWEMGNRQGEGLCTYADGNMFQGSWVANLPHGKGQCRFAEGSLYRGEFVMGKMHGFGTLIRHDGTVAFEGEWRDGEKVAPAVAPAHAPSPPKPIMQQQTPIMQQQPMHSVVLQRNTPPPQPQSERLVKLYIMVKAVSHMPRSAQGAPNPYVVVSHSAQSHITRTLHQTFEPRWDAEIGDFSVREANDLEPLLLRVFDWSPHNSDLVGEVELDVRDPVKYRVQQELTFKLMRSNGSFVWGQDGQQAELHASVSLSPPVDRAPSPPPPRAVSPPPQVYQQPVPAPRDYSPPRQLMQSMSIAPRAVQQVSVQSYSFMPPTVQAGTVLGSSRCGVGLKLIQPSRKDNVTIDKIQKDSAADVSGRLRPGDAVLKVDGQSITHLEQAKELLIGQEGSSVALEVARADGAIRIFEVVLTRKNLSIKRENSSADYFNSASYNRNTYQPQNSRPATGYYGGGGGGGSSYDPWSNESRRATNVLAPPPTPHTPTLITNQKNQHAQTLHIGMSRLKTLRGDVL